MIARCLRTGAATAKVKVVSAQTAALKQSARLLIRNDEAYAAVVCVPGAEATNGRVCVVGGNTKVCSVLGRRLYGLSKSAADRCHAVQPANVVMERSGAACRLGLCDDDTTRT